MWNSLTVAPLGTISSDDSFTISESWYVHRALSRPRGAEPSVTTDAYTVSVRAKTSAGSATRRLASRARPRLISVTRTSERKAGLAVAAVSAEPAGPWHPPSAATSARQGRCRVMVLDSPLERL